MECVHQNFKVVLDSIKVKKLCQTLLEKEKESAYSNTKAHHLNFQDSGTFKNLTMN